jgi:hypothetical protein
MFYNINLIIYHNMLSFYKYEYACTLVIIVYYVLRDTKV